MNPQVSGAGCIFVKHDHLESFLGRLQHLQWTLERHIYHDESITYLVALKRLQRADYNDQLTLPAKKSEALEDDTLAVSCDRRSW